MKRCSKCKSQKDLSQFYKDRTQKDGYMTWCISCSKEYANTRRKEDAANSRANRLKQYGLTEETYQTLFLAQNGKCAICQREETITNQHGVVSLAVDHCHRTGVVRGLLCWRCNRAIGALDDNPVLLQRAIDYLSLHAEEAFA